MTQRWPNPPYGTVEYRDMTPVGRSSVVLYTFRHVGLQEDKFVALFDKHHPLYDAWPFVSSLRVYVDDELKCCEYFCCSTASSLCVSEEPPTAACRFGSRLKGRLWYKFSEVKTATITVAVKFFLAP